MVELTIPAALTSAAREFGGAEALAEPERAVNQGADQMGMP